MKVENVLLTITVLLLSVIAALFIFRLVEDGSTVSVVINAVGLAGTLTLAVAIVGGELHIRRMLSETPDD